MQNKRISWPDIAKGIGILAVVLYHTFIPKLREDFGFYFVYTFFSVIQMPLFFFISGWLFEMKADTYKHNKLKSVGSKFVRLMIPYFSFSVIYYLLINIALNISAIAPMLSMSNGGYEKYSLPESIFQILTLENSMAKSLWFVYTLFIIIAINILIPKIMKHPLTLVILFLLPYFLMSVPSPSIVAHLFLYIPYFSLARILFNKTESILAMKKYIYAIIAILYIVGSTLYVLGQYNDIFSKKWSLLNILNIPISAFLAVLGILFICTSANYISRTKFFNKVLSYLGKNSFIIYLIHVPILTPSVVSVMIKVLPFVPPIFDCIVGLFIGIAIPLLIYELILKRVPVLNTVFLGAPLRRKNKNIKTKTER